jgi:hypothetical protein
VKVWSRRKVEGESWAGGERRDQIKERESREQQRQNDETQKKTLARRTETLV